MTTRPGPRERLLDAARELTYSQGVQVGVDAILKQADVARRSLYQHFGGKDGLVAEVLRSDDNLDRYRRVMDEAGDDPRERVLAVFDELDAIASQPSFRGCRYTAAELTLTDPGHPAHAEVRAFKEGLHRLMAAELTRHGHPAADAGADQLLVLIDGVLAHAVTRPGARPALAARALAEAVLAARA
ncbi:TetR/AcrR family transcriptional regulator [Microbispora bryophytorum]|uniref:TetR/AcrR family transcriptional regulator n=1 Tax=Microbispora bryophytorum TaxID=1460882 RepID=UPI00371F2575